MTTMIAPTRSATSRTPRTAPADRAVEQAVGRYESALRGLDGHKPEYARLLAQRTPPRRSAAFDHFLCTTWEPALEEVHQAEAALNDLMDARGVPGFVVRGRLYLDTRARDVTPGQYNYVPITVATVDVRAVPGLA
jgi:hypothetical protein